MSLQSPDYYADCAALAKPRSYRKAEYETRAKDARTEQLAKEVMEQRIGSDLFDLERIVRHLTERYQDEATRELILRDEGDIWTAIRRLYNLASLIAADKGSNMPSFQKAV